MTPRSSRTEPAGGNPTDSGHSDVKVVAVRGVVRSAERLLGAISTRLETLGPEAVYEEAAPSLCERVERIEELCRRKGVRPADMPPPSRNAYAMLAFLASNGYLLRYIEATADLKESLVPLMKSYPRECVVRLDNLRGIYRYRQRGPDWQFRLSPGFIAADTGTLSLVAKDLLCVKRRERRRKLHEFVHGDEFTGIVQDIEESVSETYETSGDTYDLDEVCERVRHQYFGTPAPRPTSLSWSSRLTYRTFGQYNSLRDRITVSRSLDNPKVPPAVVDFIMYHELLHKIHGIGWAVARQTMHTTAFRTDERRFPNIGPINRFLSAWSTVLRDQSRKNKSRRRRR
jgi:hypothetical protein